MAVRLRIVAERGRINRQIDARFRDFQRNAVVSARTVAGSLERDVDALVTSRLSRAENRGRHSGSLAQAITESIEPIATGRRQYGVGIRVTDPATLSRIAAYWHAIEVGSDHITRVRVVGFGTRQGSLFSGKLTPPGRGSGQPDAIASKTLGVPVRKTHPIRAHNYMATVSERAASRFSARIGVDLQRAFS